MRTIRRGTRQRIADTLKRHSEWKERFEADGFSKNEASRRAYIVMQTGDDDATYAKVKARTE